MSITDAYFAGLIDGEGHITLEKRSGKQVGTIPLIQVGMTDRAIVQLLQKTYGGSFAAKKIREPYKQMFVWRVKHAQARVTLKRILPYLRVKREVALTVYKFACERRAWIRQNTGRTNSISV
jgi:hypothetical protein